MFNGQVILDPYGKHDATKRVVFIVCPLIKIQNWEMAVGELCYVQYKTTLEVEKKESSSTNLERWLGPLWSFLYIYFVPAENAS